MPITLALETTHASGPLMPARIAQVLWQIAKIPGAAPAPHGSMRGQELRLVVTLEPEDDACAGFLLEFIGQGRLVRGNARGPSADLFAWAFHALADMLKCPLLDVEDEATLEPDPESYRTAALAYLAAYEGEVAETRRTPDDDEEASFLNWLVREDALALAGDAAEAETLTDRLSLDDAPGAYEMLLESDAVDEVFVSERELATLVARFKARRSIRA